jgi:CheY-like chemotaxis protein
MPNRISKYKNILLVEDDKDDQDLFVEELATLDRSITCAIAGDGSVALQMLEAALPKMPDLIVLDLNMPRLSGYEFLAILQNDDRYVLFNHIPVVILTSAESDPKMYLRLGASLCITKPESIEAYRDILSTLLKSNVNELQQQLGTRLG